MTRIAMKKRSIETNLQTKDALLIVDVQNDFLPGGRLAVPQSDKVIPVLNHTIDLFAGHALPIYASRDWHPSDHCSFQMHGGPWPVHCVAGSHGADFPTALALPRSANIISKATTAQEEAYSAFAGTDLASRLHAQGIQRLFIGGLATDYCVRRSVEDALSLGFAVLLVQDAIGAVERHPGDGKAALDAMLEQGAGLVQWRDIDPSRMEGPD